MAKEKQHGEAVRGLAAWIGEYTLGPGNPEMLPAFTHKIEAKIAEAVAPLLTTARDYWKATVSLNRDKEDELDAELTRWEPK